MAKLNTKRCLYAVSVFVGIAFCRLMFPVAAAPTPSQNGAPDGVFHGSKIAFSGDRVREDFPDDIFVMNADGTGPGRRTIRHICPTRFKLRPEVDIQRVGKLGARPGCAILMSPHGVQRATDFHGFFQSGLRRLALPDRRASSHPGTKAAMFHRAW